MVVDDNDNVDDDDGDDDPNDDDNNVEYKDEGKYQRWEEDKTVMTSLWQDHDDVYLTRPHVMMSLYLSKLVSKFS